MECTKIITAEDLSRYANSYISRGVIPELVYHLVRQSISEGDVCRIPYGDSINQQGLDGVVECTYNDLSFVPEGRSYWEIGTGVGSKKKATDDLIKRTEQVAESVRRNTSFVFVTPRSSGSWEEAWLAEHAEDGWKEIRIVDGVKLADWLREFPAIALWLATKIGIIPKESGITTPMEYWKENFCRGQDVAPLLPPSLYTATRENACRALEEVFTGKQQCLFICPESEDGVNDFVAAYFASSKDEKIKKYANQCLFISEPEAWKSIAGLRKPHILVADTELDLDSERQDLRVFAENRGHRLVIPLFGSLSDPNAKVVKLPSPIQYQIEEILRNEKFSDIRARELAQIGNRRLSALRRYIWGGSVPRYAKWDCADDIARVNLLGRWSDRNSADVQVLENILEIEGRKGLGKLRSILSHADTPLARLDGKWRIVPRGEVWNTLGNRLSDEDLEHFQEMALLVLGERDPKFDLPKEERYAANVLGKELKYSGRLRKGVAETLALMGSRPEKLEQCSHGKAEAVAAYVVRNLLHEADWERWAGLDPLMPLLAEAAPKVFLDAVEEALGDLGNTPFHAIFMQEGDGLFGGNYMTGLLWGLECLAWSHDYLARVAVILADLASIDPGGRYSNRPAQSFADIFLPWHLQTTASLDQRMVAIKVVLKEQPNVGWKLLLSLLPHSLGSTSGCYRPVWRNFIPADWEDGVLVSEYWAQIHMLAEFAAEMAHSDVERLMELMDRLSDLPQETQEVVLNHLMSDHILRMPEPERVIIWEKLDGLVRRHRKFSNAQWALPKETITKIEQIANDITPADLMLRYRYLFSESDHDLFDEKGKYEEQRERLDEKRRLALAEIMGDGDFARCLDFAQKTAMPYKVGQTLGGIASDRVEAEILPSQLTADDEVVKRVVAGFVWARFWQRGIQWVDELLKRNWETPLRAEFLLLLPFQGEIWERVSSYLGKSYEELYWKHVDVRMGVWKWEDPFVIEKLIAYGRAGAVVTCLTYALDYEEGFDPDIVTRALIAVLENPQEIEQLERYDTVELIKRLQSSTGVDIEALYQIEMNFLPWFDRLSGDVPVALEKSLASDPAFFAEMIKYAFRSKNDSADSAEQKDAQKQFLAERAYMLLNNWRSCPGIQEDGALNEEVFRNWVTEARRITEESGHDEIAQIELGKVLAYAPQDPGGLWIHKAVAAVLNERTTGRMRFNFMIALMNQRGVYSFSHGSKERELARGYREKAEALDIAGYTRFATTMRELADQYDADAERDERRDPFEDYS
ncbi:hypothetical protein [Selenomonas artemidis]|uniref:hypothetical protein n=1 Tax=Selenomonas artemidis TaxID=671224 RepID=UPI0002E26D3A|nr:hypothetical protein [Selenomonas artemidis]